MENILEREMKRRNINYIFSLGVFNIGGVNLLDLIDESAERYVAKSNSLEVFDKYRQRFTPSYDFYTYAGFYGTDIVLGFLSYEASDNVMNGFMRGCAQSPNIAWCKRVYGILKTHDILNCMFIYFLLLHSRCDVLDIIMDDNFPDIIRSIFYNLKTRCGPNPLIVKYLLKGITPEAVLCGILENITVDEESYIEMIKAIGLNNQFIVKMADHYSLYKIKRAFNSK